MKKNKVYTKTGDDANTSLISGARIEKHNVRVKAYGALDELNCCLGLIRSFSKSDEDNIEIIKIQENIMNINSELANDKNIDLKINKIDNKDIVLMEYLIDSITDKLPELKSFIIPGGNKLASIIHLTRSTCRRAERDLSELNASSKVEKNTLIYINRLSDYLFTLSRKVLFESNLEELKWEQSKNT